MRRYTLMFLLLCLYGLARGQTDGYNCYYWFDDDHASLRKVTSQTDSWQLMADASGLSESLHTIHLLVRDSEGRQSKPMTQLFMHTSELTEQSLAYYWFDCQDGKPMTSPMLQGSFNIDASDLADGLHTFHYMVAKNNGSISLPTVTYFVKMPKGDATMKGYYWFDEDTDIHEVAVTNGTFEVDASHLSDGFHRFHYQVLHSNGTTSMPTANFFLKTAQVSNGDMLNCICSVDGQLHHIEKLSLQGGIIHWDLDMHDLTDGFHRIQLQAVTPSGAMCSSYTSYFMRVTTAEELGDMHCVYAIDNDIFNTNASIEGNDGNYHFDLDLSELSDGLHHISYMLYNDRGTSTKIQTRFFLKVPLGGNAIGQYQYWLNDDDINEAKTVTLPQKVNPLQLMSLLPVESRPLRSSLFQFGVSSGQPKIYAKNTIHLRFYDVAMRFTDAVKDYADYSVSQDVNVIKELESGIRETTSWPEENEIKWYQVTAERGDSLRFKLDHAATLQLFTPSGKLVYNVSGIESVNWGGLHAAEMGTFYLALHDVTATQGDDISIDYEHIDKYAVLRQDVSLVGNGGCSTITFEGNGFRDLYAVDLYNERGDSIKHIYIGHESDATTSVAFDFTGAALGVYHAKFHFTEEDKVFTNLVTVEEARDIELATTVTYPSTFLRGTSTTYAIKITNKGNMTAYNVPLSIKISNSADNDISHVTLDGLDLKNLFDYIEDFDGWTQAEIEDIRKQCDAIGEDHYFIKVKSADDKGDSIFVRTGLFGLIVPPNTTKTISLTLTASENVEVWVATAKEVPPLTSYTYAEQTTNRVRYNIGVDDIHNWFCCHYEQITCFGNIVADIADLASLFTGPEGAILMSAISCASNIISQITTVAGTAFCNEEFIEKSLKERIKEIYNNISIVGTIVSCLSHVALKSQQFMEWFEKVISNGSLAFDVHSSLSFECFDAFLSKKPNCPPEPKGGTSNSVVSMDPNDIYGYSAESGSHAVKDGLTDVYYRIEFENDPAFATAAAHEIVVTDTLDATKFDLSTFTPTRVRIGEKSAELNGDKNFVTTIDMRPEINAIAQVTGTYDQSKGIAKWHITSLDPMTMEPTDDVMQGVLPVNYNGNGMGEVMFDISLKPGLAHGTTIDNRAAIVFDKNDVIMTPTWTNIIDRIAPESHVTNVVMANDSTAMVSITATDELSGPWRYNVYVQYGSGAWFLGAENVPIDKPANVRVYEGINHGFYAVVTDSAGNVEQKQAEREFTFEIFRSQMETNTKVQLAQGWNWMSHNQDAPLLVEAMKPKAQRIISQTAELHKDNQQNWSGYLEELLPTEMYKVQMVEANELSLSGLLFNATFRSVPLRKGWNWIGYPVANAMSVGEALSKLEAEEGDAILSQDGIAIFSDGQWTGTLSTMYPGIGYMYRSVSDKNLFLNASAQYSARKMKSAKTEQEATWSTDKHSYPDVMGFVADLYQNDSRANYDDYVVGAFCNGECRGIAKMSDGHLMMNVYGENGDVIKFRALHCESGEVLTIAEKEIMRTDVIGSIHQPYDLHIGRNTGIVTNENPHKTHRVEFYDMQGRRIDNSQIKKGVYLQIDSGQKKSRKIVNK